MLAFVGTTVSKAQIITQLEAHAREDEIIKGQYWSGGKGCAVGCTIHSADHGEYEPRFGIPIMLARLEDCIFEGLPNDTAKEWPLRFMRAVQPGSDLSLVGWKFLHLILTDRTINPGIEHELVRDAVKQCADIIVPLTKGKRIDESAARSAESAAASAAARIAAARIAAASAAARSAESAARSAAASVAASAAASAAARLAAASAVWSAAASAAWLRMADALIGLISAAPIVTADNALSGATP